MNTNLWMSYLFAVSLFALPWAPLCGEPSDDSILAELMVNGAAAIEQGRGDDAIQAFEKCKALKPDSAATWVNLALAYLEVDKYQSAIEALAQAERLDAELPHIAYNLALCQKHLRQPHLAMANFRKVLAMDAKCAEGNYNLGVIQRDLNQWELARKHFEEAVKLNPNHLFSHYHLMRLAMRRADNSEALKHFKLFANLRSRAPRTALDPHVAERSRYSLPLPPRSLGGWDSSELPASFGFKEMTTPLGSEQVSEVTMVTWCELDGDGLPDIAIHDGRALHFMRNSKGLKFSTLGHTVETQAARQLGIGDFDNDNRLDVVVAGMKDLKVVLNRSEEGMTSISLSSPQSSTEDLTEFLPIDYDHDGDLDVLLLEQGSPPVASVIQNRGDGAYRRIPEVFKGGGYPNSFTAGDMDNDDDIDFVFANADGAPLVYENLGAGRFQLNEPVGELQNAPSSTRIHLADLNNDLRLDMVLVTKAGSLLIFFSSGATSYRSEELTFSSAGKVRTTCIADLDNDGFLDLGVCYGLKNELGELELFRGTPDGFLRLQRDLLPNEGKGFSAKQLLPEDADLDGDIDLLVVEETGKLRLLINEGTTGNHWLRVDLTGLRSNAAGTGVRLDVRDGWRRIRRQGNGLPIHFGLGKREKIQVLRLLWTSGLVQNHLSPQSNQTLAVREDARIPASCPFLFVGGPDNYEFLTDFLGGGATGEYSPPGEPYIPDTDDVLIIGGNRLQSDHGAYPLRVTFELQEVIYLDSVSLSAVYHAADVTVIADEALYQPPRKGITLHVVRNLRPISGAFDTTGRACTELLRHSDKNPVYDFELARQPGLTDTHSLTIDIGKDADPARTVLVARGWTQWPNSSSVLGRSQSKSKTITWPRLEMKDRSGRWRTVPVPMGVPAGKLRPVMYDLRNQWLSDNRQVRLVTSMAIFWDQAEVGEIFDEDFEVETLELKSAQLRWRGYSTPFMNPEGTLEFYRYLPTLGYWPWKRQSGYYTQHGSVDRLIKQSDGRLLIAAHGDELQLAFKSSGRKAPQQFVFHAVGVGKDSDPNTENYTTVGPIPVNHFGVQDGNGLSEPPGIGRLFEVSLPRNRRTK